MKEVSHKKLYVRNPDTGEFEPLMAIRGESAYEIAVRLGTFTGTEEEWNNALETERAAAVKSVEDKGAETLASIPDDYTALSEEAARLEADKIDKTSIAQELGDSEEKVLSQGFLKDIYTDFTKQALVHAEMAFEQKTFSPTNAEELDSSNRLLSDYIPIQKSSPVAVTVKDGYSYRILVFDENKVYLKVLPHTAFTTEEYTFTETEERYIRVNMCRTDDADIGVREGENVSVKLPQTTYIQSAEKESFLQKREFEDTFNQFAENGYIKKDVACEVKSVNAENGEEVASEIRLTTEDICLKPNARIKVKAEDGYKFKIFVYDSERVYRKSLSIYEFISGEQEMSFDDEAIVVINVTRTDNAKIVTDEIKNIDIFIDQQLFAKKTDLDEYVSYDGYAELHPSFEKKSYDISGGKIVDSSIRLLSDPIFLKRGDVLKVYPSENYNVRCIVLDYKHGFVESLPSDEWHNGKVSVTSDDDRFVMVNMTRNDNGAIDVSESENVKIIGRQNVYATKDDLLEFDYSVPEYVRGVTTEDAYFKKNSSDLLADVYGWYDNLTSIFEDMTREQIGTSHEPIEAIVSMTNDSATYPIYAYTIAPKKEARHKFVLCGGIHGDGNAGDGIEGVSACAYLVRDLLCNDGKNKYTKYIRDYCTIVVVPIINPYGYKNRLRQNERNIDLNRNFDVDFVPNGESYAGLTGGEVAFSENESLALKTFIETYHSDSSFLYELHTSGNPPAEDDRWVYLYKNQTAPIVQCVAKAAYKMSKKYGGTTHYSLSGWGQCASYFDKIMNIPAWETENVKTNDSYDYMMADFVMIQNENFMAEMVIAAARHLFGIR